MVAYRCTSLFPNHELLESVTQDGQCIQILISPKAVNYKPKSLAETQRSKSFPAKGTACISLHPAGYLLAKRVLGNLFRQTELHS